MSKYINPYTDFGFKKLFGEEANKDLLIDFLNTFLPEKHRIKTLNFRNPEQLGSIYVDRRAVFDIYCEAENGEQFIVEMQKAKQHFFKDRSIFNTAFLIREQAEKGEAWKYELQDIYFVGILDFVYDEHEERQKFMRDVSLKDQDGDPFYDKLHYILLQMPRFEKTEQELETHQDKWLFFLKNLTNFDEIPAILREQVFERAFETAAIARMSKQEYFRYELDRKVLRDNYAILTTAIDDGMARGKVEGRAEGKAEGLVEGETKKALEVARNMKHEGFDSCIIAKMTGLSPDEIERLN